MTPSADIGAMVDEKFLPSAMNKTNVLSKLGGQIEQILEVMQQNYDDDDNESDGDGDKSSTNDSFTPSEVARIQEQLRKWKSKKGKKSGQVFLDAIKEAKKEIKEKFAFSLFAVDAKVLHEASPELHKAVSEIAAEEYIRIGPATIRKHPFQKALEGRLRDAVGEKSEIAFIQVGKAGVGKSTLINALVGGSHAETSSDLNPCTTEANAHRVSLSGDLPISLLMWDTPGLEDAFIAEEGHRSASGARTENCLKSLAQKVKKVELFLFCIDSTNPRHSTGISNIMNSVTKAFTKDIWQHCMFVFTKANLLRATSTNNDDDDDDNYDERHFKSTIDSLIKGHRELLLKHGIDEKVVDSIRFVPVGSGRDRVLPNGKSWLPEFWVAAVEKATSAGGSFLLMFNHHRLQLRTDEESEKETSLTSSGKRKDSKIVLSEEHLKRIVGVASRLTGAPGAGVYAAIVGGGIGVGAAIGAVAGAPFFGPIGAAAGAAIGAGVGAVGGGIASLVTWIKKSKKN